jgi:hypothetical protein
MGSVTSGPKYADSQEAAVPHGAHPRREMVPDPLAADGRYRGAARLQPARERRVHAGPDRPSAEHARAEK